MWNPMLATRAYDTWNNEPGGTVVGRMTDPLTGTKYVLVEFENSPGKIYVYYAN